MLRVRSTESIFLHKCHYLIFPHHPGADRHHDLWLQWGSKWEGSEVSLYSLTAGVGHRAQMEKKTGLLSTRNNSRFFYFNLFPSLLLTWPPLFATGGGRRGWTYKEGKGRREKPRTSCNEKLSPLWLCLVSCTAFKLQFRIHLCRQ